MFSSLCFWIWWTRRTERKYFNNLFFVSLARVTNHETLLNIISFLALWFPVSLGAGPADQMAPYRGAFEVEAWVWGHGPQDKRGRLQGEVMNSTRRACQRADQMPASSWLQLLCLQSLRVGWGRGGAIVREQRHRRVRMMGGASVSKTLITCYVQKRICRHLHLDWPSFWITLHTEGLWEKPSLALTQWHWSVGSLP